MLHEQTVTKQAFLSPFSHHLPSSSAFSSIFSVIYIFSMLFSLLNLSLGSDGFESFIIDRNELLIFDYFFLVPYFFFFFIFRRLDTIISYLLVFSISRNST